jgi:hypothetical protein
MAMDQKEETGELLRRASAISELQSFTAKYHLGKDWLVGDEATRIIDKAVSKAKTEPGVHQEMRTQLFNKLTQVNPQQAIKIEMEYFQHRGFKPDTDLQKKLTSITSGTFETSHDAYNAYFKATTLLRKEFDEFSHAKKGAEKPKPPEEKKAAEQALQQKIKPATQPVTVSEHELTKMAFKVLSVSYELEGLSERLSYIGSQKTDEFVSGQSRKKGSEEKYDTSSLDLLQRARTYAQSSQEYQSIFSEMKSKFDERDAVLRGMGFKETKVLSEVNPVGDLSFKRIDLNNVNDRNENLKMFEAFMAPILISNMGQSTSEFLSALSSFGVSKKDIGSSQKELDDARNNFIANLKGMMHHEGAVLASTFLSTINPSEASKYIHLQYMQIMKEEQKKVAKV